MLMSIPLCIILEVPNTLSQWKHIDFDWVFLEIPMKIALWECCALLGCDNILCWTWQSTWLHSHFWFYITMIWCGMRGGRCSELKIIVEDMNVWWYMIIQKTEEWEDNFTLETSHWLMNNLNNLARLCLRNPSRNARVEDCQKNSVNKVTSISKNYLLVHNFQSLLL